MQKLEGFGERRAFLSDLPMGALMDLYINNELDEPLESIEIHVYDSSSDMDLVKVDDYQKYIEISLSISAKQNTMIFINYEGEPENVIAEWSQISRDIEEASHLDSDYLYFKLLPYMDFCGCGSRRIKTVEGMKFCPVCEW